MGRGRARRPGRADRPGSTAPAVSTPASEPLFSIRRESSMTDSRRSVMPAAVLFVSLLIAALVTARGVPAQVASPEPWPEGEKVPVSGLDGAHWFRTRDGWIVLEDPGHADRAATEMRAAAKAYERHFGKRAPKGAVLDLALVGARNRMRSAGAAWVLTYPFDRVERSAAAVGQMQRRDSARADRIRSQIESRLEARGIERSKREIDAMVERTLARMDDSEKGDGRHPDARRALRHEVAHELFIAGQWPASDSGRSEYGGGAPDWLDEAAAVMAESPRMTEARRSAFRELVADGETIGLRRYFSMEHPLYGSDRFRAALDSARTAGAVVLSGDDVDVGRAADFYAQTRGLVDFLLERSGDRTIFAEIAGALKAGTSIGTWLEAHGPEHGLPTSVAGLEDALLEWALSPRNDPGTSTSVDPTSRSPSSTTPGIPPPRP